MLIAYQSSNIKQIDTFTIYLNLNINVFFYIKISINYDIANKIYYL